MSTTGKRIGTVSISGSMWVEIKAREVKIVAAQRSDSLMIVSSVLTSHNCCVVRDVARENYLHNLPRRANRDTLRLDVVSMCS